MSVQGLKEVVRALQGHKKKTAQGVRVGLIRAGLFLQRESQKVVPVDTGLLRSTANTRAEGQGFDTKVVVSYGTDYGVHVHEDLEMRHKPGKIAKYLEKPARDNKANMTKIVMKAIKENR